MRNASWGGSEEQWFSLALWLGKANCNVTVCIYDWGEKSKVKVKQLTDAGCTIIFLPLPVRSKKLTDKIKKGTIDKWRLTARLKNIPFENYQYIFVNQGGSYDITHGPIKFLYKRLKTFILSYHNYSPGQTIHNKKKRLMQQWVCSAAHNLGDAGRIFECLENQLQLPIPNKLVCCNPITFSAPIAPADYPKEKDPVIIGVFAALDIERKAQDVLIHAFAAGKQWKNRNWELHLYGAGKDEVLLKELISSKGLNEKIFLKGHTNNMREALLSCHLVMQITKIDAMPISVVEAMAMARPCVVSDVGDMASWIRHNENGFVCESVTKTVLAAMLETVWEQRNEWKQMGIRAFHTFLEKYPRPYNEHLANQLFKQ